MTQRGVSPSRFRLADRSLKAHGVEIEGVGTHIDEDGRGAAKHRHLGGRDEGEGGYEHGVAGAYVFGHQGQKQRVGAVGATDAVPRAAEGGKLAFEFGDLRPKNVLAMVEHRQHRLVEAVAQKLALRREVDEGGNGLLAVLTHAISNEALRRILAAERAVSGSCGLGAPGHEYGRFSVISLNSSGRPRRRLP
jgi:hypothetical protein